MTRFEVWLRRWLGCDAWACEAERQLIQRERARVEVGRAADRARRMERA